MVKGRMIIGLTGVETITVPNASLEYFRDFQGSISEGENLVPLVGETWVNPAHVTYLKFVKD